MGEVTLSDRLLPERVVVVVILIDMALSNRAEPRSEISGIASAMAQESRGR
jgi:hypothetical protein